MKRVVFALAALVACETPPPAAPQKTEPPPPEPSAVTKVPEAESKPEPEQDAPPVRKDGTILGSSELMGTRVSINVFLGTDKGAAEAGKAMEAALAEMARIEEIMSEWKETSELTAFNRASGGEPFELGPELFEVLQRGHEIAGETGGAFDPTFHGVGQLWSFAPGSEPPTKKAVKDKLPLVDWKSLELDAEGRKGRLAKPGMMVGLGAIAKGYAVDRASALLRSRGFPNHVVEAGGDTFAAGKKGDRPWMVGVQDPDELGTIGAIPTSDRAVVTSGDYQRFFEHEGKRYAHILDPRTGWPLRHDKSAKSVTLIAQNATDADAYCTAVTVMGPKRGLEFVESRDDLDAVIIKRDGNVIVTSGLRDLYVAAPTKKPK